MNAKQFTAPSAREAMAMARKALGPDAVILNNRKTAQGICVTAMLEADLVQLDQTLDPNEAEQMQAPVILERSELTDPNSPNAAIGLAEPSRSEQVIRSPLSEPMSTVNFQRFANERRSRTPMHAEADKSAQAQHSTGVPEDPGTGKQIPARASEQPRNDSELAKTQMSQSQSPRTYLPEGASVRPPTSATGHQETASELLAMAGELRQMRSFISQQFSALSWVDGVRRTPGQAQVLRRVLQAGFSSQLARSIVGHLPEGCGGQAADDWLSHALARNLDAPAWTDNVINAGGVFALVGPTGVGKTTSVAKIAARCALEHGIDEVGLITADAYRVGAQDQLRRFGSMIGITVHTAHDAQSLHGLLSLLQTKRIVLIDTAGLGQRDPRVSTLVDAVSQGPIQRLLVLSAAAQIESIREAIESYEGNDCAGVLLTKLDEACRLGGALDSLIRFRMPLLAVADGQRVPEDWHDANVESLVKTALTTVDADDVGLPDIDLTMLMQRVDSGGGDAGLAAASPFTNVAGAL